VAWLWCPVTGKQGDALTTRVQQMIGCKEREGKNLNEYQRKNKGIGSKLAHVIAAALKGFEQEPVTDPCQGNNLAAKERWPWTQHLKNQHQPVRNDRNIDHGCGSCP